MSQPTPILEQAAIQAVTADDAPIVGQCPYCARPLRRKSLTGRTPKFCDAKCRIYFYRQQKKEGAS